MSFPNDTTATGQGGEGPQGPQLSRTLLKELEADYPGATSDVMALALEEVNPFHPPKRLLSLATPRVRCQVRKDDYLQR